MLHIDTTASEERSAGQSLVSCYFVYNIRVFTLLAARLPLSSFSVDRGSAIHVGGLFSPVPGTPADPGDAEWILQASERLAGGWGGGEGSWKHAGEENRLRPPAHRVQD